PVSALRENVGTYISHVEAVQNVVCLHMAGSNADLDEITSLASANASSINQFLSTESGEADFIFGDLQNIMSSHQRGMALFAKELHEIAMCLLPR
ncbi:hypothetical protein MKW98_008870, partial [Papaver atlanticum]